MKQQNDIAQLVKDFDYFKEYWKLNLSEYEERLRALERNDSSGCKGCESLQRELDEQRTLAKKYRKPYRSIEDINEYFDSLYNNVMDDTQALGSCIQRAAVELKELEDKNAA